jgi:hypothetical protein
MRRDVVEVGRVEREPAFAEPVVVAALTIFLEDGTRRSR